jgi:putative spermidine/putrescine transport system ATP-binding protein
MSRMIHTSTGPDRMMGLRLVLDRVSVVDFSEDPNDLVSFSLAAGRCLVLFGDVEDAGRLLVDIVAGHVRQRAGTVLLDGRDLGRLPPEARGIGLVSARDPLFPHLDVSGNIGFPLRARAMDAGERNRRVRDTQALLGLDAASGQRPGRLGTGDRVRTMMARALVFGPSVLVLDAPFAGVGPLERIVLQRTLRRLTRARGLTVLMTTTDRDEALLLGDEIGVLEGGRLHQVDTAIGLLDRPANPVVARRVGDANLLSGQVVRIDDEVALVRLANGAEMEAEVEGVLEIGAPCVLCVRPDRIATAFLSRPNSGTTENAVVAILLEAIHFGDHLRLRFRLADGGEMLVRRPPAASMAELRPDRTALLAWQAHQARVFAVPA